MTSSIPCRERSRILCPGPSTGTRTFHDANGTDVVSRGATIDRPLRELGQKSGERLGGNAVPPEFLPNPVGHLLLSELLVDERRDMTDHTALDQNGSNRDSRVSSYPGPMRIEGVSIRGVLVREIGRAHV